MLLGGNIHRLWGGGLSVLSPFFMALKNDGRKKEYFIKPVSSNTCSVPPLAERRDVVFFFFFYFFQRETRLCPTENQQKTRHKPTKEAVQMTHFEIINHKN